MSVGIPKGTSHSAIVTAILRIDGRDVPLGSAGPNEVIVREPFECARDAIGEVLITVDGSEFGKRVTLPEGARLASKRVAIKDCE